MATKDIVKETEITETEEVKSRIPSSLDDNPILVDFCNRYLEVADEIAKYNEEVLKKSDNEWTRPKLLEEAKKLGRPDDMKNSNPTILEALKQYENAVEQLSIVRDSLYGTVANELGITLSATTGERDPEKEAPLKEKRKLAVSLGSTLNMMAEMSSDKDTTHAVTEFLVTNPLPIVGREQSRSFSGEDNKPTPRYRVKVTVSKDGNVLGEYDGFTKTALALSAPTFNYPRGESPKADKFRQAWEAAGNTTCNTVKSTVEFEDNGLHYILTQK
jgi:hypothetical protein